MQLGKKGPPLSTAWGERQNRHRRTPKRALLRSAFLPLIGILSTGLWSALSSSALWIPETKKREGKRSSERRWKSETEEKRERKERERERVGDGGWGAFRIWTAGLITTGLKGEWRLAGFVRNEIWAKVYSHEGQSSGILRVLEVLFSFIRTELPPSWCFSALALEMSRSCGLPAFGESLSVSLSDLNCLAERGS